MRSALADAACAGLPLTVTVADSWARLFMVAPPHNAGRLQDLQAAAAMRFQALYGELPSAWEIQADWQAGAPFLACALPRPLLAALQQIAIDNKLHLLSVQAQFVAAWNTCARTLPADTWFGVVQDHSLTLGASPRHHAACTRCAASPSRMTATSRAGCKSKSRRAALQLNVPTPTQLHLVGKQRPKWNAPNASGGTLDRAQSGAEIMKRLAIDFAPRTLRRSLLQTHPLAWLCGAVGLAMCAAAAQTAHTLADKIDAQDSAMRRIQTQLSQRSEQQPVIKKNRHHARRKPPPSTPPSRN